MSLVFFGTILALIHCLSGYDIQFTTDLITFYSGNLVKPYSIKLLDSNYMLVCFEQRDANTRAGDCKTGLIDGISKGIAFSQDYIFENFAASDPYQIQLRPASQFGEYFIMAYSNSATSSRGHGVAIMGKYNKNDGSISYGLKRTFNPFENDQNVLVELQANGYFIICASVGPSNQYETACRIGNYTVDNLSLQYSQKYYNITSDIRTDGMGILRIDSTAFIICYGRGILEVGVCNIGRVLNNFNQGIDSTIVYTNEITFNSEGGTENVRITLLKSNADNSHWIAICYQSRNDGACSVALVKNDNNAYTLSILGRYVFENETISAQDMFVIPDGQIDLGNPNPIIIICYTGVNASECVVGEYNEATNVIYFQSDKYVFAQVNTGGIDLIYLGDNKMIVCYVKFSGSTPFYNNGVCQFADVVKPVRD